MIEKIVRYYCLNFVCDVQNAICKIVSPKLTV